MIQLKTNQSKKLRTRKSWLMENHDLDQKEAEHVQEIMEEYDLDEDEAIELTQGL